jgi:hypothetical protein
MILYAASWWGACTPFKDNLKKLYESWNKKEKVVEVIVVSGDNNEAGFNKTMAGFRILSF